MYNKCGGQRLGILSSGHNTHAYARDTSWVWCYDKDTRTQVSQELRIILVNSPRHKRNPLLAFPQKLSTVIRPEEVATVINESKTRLTPQFYKLPRFTCCV
jgi:hypothetical protein